jgi:crossover junction endodeoxyribonuclease RuvC
MSNYAGIDLSLAETGIVVVDEAGKLVDIKTIRPTSEYKGAERLHEIVQEIMITLRTFVPEALAIESLTGGGKFAFMLSKLAELHGAVKHTLFAHLGNNSGAQVFLVAPATLKKYATGSGRAEKSDVKLAIYKKWGETFRNNNAADAYVLAQIAKTAGLDEPPEHQYQKECLKAIHRGY